MNQLDDYLEIQQYLTHFWQAMDRADYDEVLSGLTEDARWLRDRWREGKADILESLIRRAPLLVSRHCVVNLAVSPRQHGYDCVYGLIIFSHTRTMETEAAPYVTSGPRMGDWHARLVNQDGRWLAQEITAALIFERR
jgi:hypothetical protein